MALSIHADAGSEGSAARARAEGAPKATHVAADVSKSAEVEKAVEGTIERSLGRFRHFVNAHGIFPTDPSSRWTRMSGIVSSRSNTRGTMLTCRAVGRRWWIAVRPVRS